MDTMKTGALIRQLRQKQGLTQLALAQQLNVSDKAVSKWERGCGAPDVSLLPALSQALGADLAALLRGDLAEKAAETGNFRRLKFFVCPTCGNLLFATGSAALSCCGHSLLPLTPQSPDPAHDLTAELNDGEWYLTSPHEMHREHSISFVALLSGDTLLVKKLYPEWALQARLPRIPHSTLLWYCTRDGLFARRL